MFCQSVRSVRRKMKIEMLPRTLSTIACVDTLATVKDGRGADCIIYPFFVKDGVLIRALSGTTMCSIEVPKNALMSIEAADDGKFALTRGVLKTIVSVVSSTNEPVTLKTKQSRGTTTLLVSNSKTEFEAGAFWDSSFDAAFGVDANLYDSPLIGVKDGKQFMFDMFKLSERFPELAFRIFDRKIEVTGENPVGKVKLQYDFSLDTSNHIEVSGTFSSSKIRRALLGYNDRDAERLFIKLENEKPLMLQYKVGFVGVKYAISPRVSGDAKSVAVEKKGKAKKKSEGANGNERT